MLNVPVNNFSVMLGRGHRFRGNTSTFGVNMSCSRTQHGDPGSGVRGVYRQGTAPPLRHLKGEASILFDFFNITLAFGGLAPPDPFFTFRLFSVYWLTIVSISIPLCPDFEVMNVHTRFFSVLYNYVIHQAPPYGCTCMCHFFTTPYQRLCHRYTCI